MIMWWGGFTEDGTRARLEEVMAFYRDMGVQIDDEDERVFWRAVLEGLLYGPQYAVDPRPGRLAR